MYKKIIVRAGMAALAISAIISNNCLAVEQTHFESSKTIIFYEEKVDEEGTKEEKAAKETPKSEIQPPEMQAPETQAPETQVPETQAPETQTPETQPSETQAPETQAPETQPPETQIPEAQLPETPATETQAPETQVPETQAPETQVPETQAPETQAPETGNIFNSEEIVTSTEKPETETESKGKTRKKKEETEENETDPVSPYATNEALIAAQNIIPPTRTSDFRFTRTKGELVLIQKNSLVYTEKDILSDIVGYSTEKSYGYILEDKEDGWFYIESGKVRGFIRSKQVVTGKVASLIWERDTKENFSELKEKMPYLDNPSLDYIKKTTETVLISKKYALSKNNVVSIYEDTDFDNARIIGKVPSGGIAYILEEVTSDIVYVESGNVRGFARKDSFITGKRAEEKVSENGEGSFTTATEIIKAEENHACYYTFKSVKKANDVSIRRQSIVDFALQFLGNPYVWGGTSLTNGADCSGFVQSIYAYYGYSLPRVACDQALYGTQIPVSEAQPGDLIFYARNGYVYHVSMYIGDGQVVHAYGKSVGIITSGIESTAVWATSILD